MSWPEFDILETEMIDEPYENNYANGMEKMNDSMVEQLTVPEDSQDFNVK